MEFVNWKGEKVEFDPFNATNVKRSPALKEGEFFLLDGPGITGREANSLELMQKHAEAGGKFIHKMALDENGNLQLVEPQYMWPKPGN